MNKRSWALLAAFAASAIYGLNHSLAKGVMPDYIQPFAFIMLRVSGAAILFWIISPLGPKEKIAGKDWPRLVLCALLGMGINMLTFFKGLQLSTPINSSVLVTLTPIIVVILSALLLRERVSLNKGLGILLGFLGALGLILFGAEVRQDAPNIPLGNFLFVINAITYGSYLILVKKLIEKYHPFTMMKWLFGISAILTLPVTLPEFLEIQWAELPMWVFGTVLFVIVCTTFLAYLFNIFALSQLRATTVGAFVYLEPLVGILFALALGTDTLSPVKALAALMVLVGVFLASRKPRPEGKLREKKA
jgi:drug/metabolite transporter (DMT)-like permease